MGRRRVFLLIAQLTVIAVALTALSVARYVLAHPGNSVQQNVAAWARNKGLGGAVDALEARLHDRAPSSAPANSLALALEGPLGATTSTSVTSSPASTTVPRAPTTTLPGQPDPIAPRILPALVGEGQWRSIAEIGGRDVVWATSLRPLREYGSVVATVVTFDPRDFRVALFNGTETPGGGPWVNGKRVMKAALPALVATFNGGFRLDHDPGGYVTEGRVVRKLKNGYATFAIDSDGIATVGVWGRGIGPSDRWVSLRQNLPPVVEDGIMVYSRYSWIEWGKDYDNKIFNLRSAVCSREDGRMSFVAVGDVNIDMLARTLVIIGCRTAMEMDINGTWPQFTTYSGFGTPNRWGRVVDTRMGNPNRFLRESTKDFFALFDPGTLPEGVVR